MKQILAVAVFVLLGNLPVEARAAGLHGPRFVQSAGALPANQHQPGQAVTGEAVTGEAVTGEAVTGEAVTGQAVTVAQSPAPGQAQSGSPIEGADTDAAPKTFEDKLAGFVSDIYLTGEARSRADLEELYAPTVEYFESGRLTRERVLSDKQAYYMKWPQREYRLIRESLKSQWRAGSRKVLDVTFDYDFDVASSARRSRGRGRASLTLDLTLDGGRITREQGFVLQRW